MDLQERIRVQVDGNFQCSCRLCQLDRSDRFIMQREKLCEQIESVNQLPKSDPKKTIQLIEPILEKLRQTYLKRPELQTHLFLPLYELGKLSFEIKEYKQCVVLLKEVEEKMGKKLFKERVQRAMRLWCIIRG